MGTFQFLMLAIIVICALLVLVVLSQNPKGGGLSSTFGGSGGGQMFGVQRTNDFLDKATWTLAVIIVALVIMANIFTPNPNARFYQTPAADTEIPITAPEQQPQTPQE